MTDAYDIGDAEELTITFTDVNGADADPDTVTFKMREPDGVETIYTYGTDVELSKSATGKYVVTWRYAKPGRHVHRFDGVGTVEAAAQRETWVRKGP